MSEAERPAVALAFAVAFALAVAFAVALAFAFAIASAVALVVALAVLSVIPAGNLLFLYKTKVVLKNNRCHPERSLPLQT